MDVKKFLRENRVAFEVTRHPVTFTAQEVAASEHVPGKQMAKTVIVKADDKFLMLVLPAPQLVDLKKVGGLVGGAVTLAAETDLKQLFPDCDVGAEPPFGSQYGLRTFVEESLASSDEIVFRAGSHAETIKTKYADYEKLEKPTRGRFGILAQAAG